MEQVRHYVCKSCSTPVPQGHKFCGRCGESVPPEILTARTMFFSDMQNPAKAKLILIRGEGMDGLSFHLKAEQHVVGRNGQLVFPDDPFISPKHANFFYRDGRLVVRDEGSLNGVYLRVRGTVEVQPGDQFLVAASGCLREDDCPVEDFGGEVAQRGELVRGQTGGAECQVGCRRAFRASMFRRRSFEAGRGLPVPPVLPVAGRRWRGRARRRGRPGRGSDG